ncbi:dihydropteroate synthase [Streptomyces sp. Tue6028]|uniref:dihydropteroate synthase n=1 Tax=Streptomyces sp. Tue6028 TaxID=2036037 RepID=UPI003EB87FC0
MTADSSPEASRYLAAEGAVGRARRLRSEGADIIELGPAASSLEAQEVGAAEEIRRLTDVMDQVVAESVPVSVDSFLPEFQRFAVARRSPVPQRHPRLSRSGPFRNQLGSVRQLWRRSCTRHGTERITPVPMTWAPPTMRSPSSTPGKPPKEEHDGSARSDRRGGATQRASARHPAGSAGQAVRILGAPQRQTRTR